MLNLIKSSFTKSIAIIVFLLIWEVLPRIGIIDSFALPPFSTVVIAFINLALSGELLVNVGASLERAGLGFLLSLAVGIPLGILMGWFSKLEKFINPLIQIFRNTPVTALYPIFIIFFGLGEFSKISVIFWASIWATLINTIGGVKSIDPLLIKSARSMGISEFSLFRKVVLPASLPSVITGMRLSASTAVILLITAEMLGGSKGIGVFIFNSQQMYKIPEMYAGIITISLIGITINQLLVQFEKHTLVWKEQIVNN